MKRTFLFLAAFAVVATSCSKNTLVDTPNVVYDASTINFNLSTGLSKANDNTIAALYAGFDVHALIPNKAEGGSAAHQLLFTTPTTIGSGSELRYHSADNGVTWKWARPTTPNDKLWPVDVDGEKTNYPIIFIASLPTVDKFQDNYALAELTTTSWLSEDLEQIDDVTKHEDYLAAKYTQGQTPAAGKNALLQFKHITAGILFNVTIPVGWSVVVKEVIYHNLHQKSTFNYLDTAWTAVPAAAGTSKYKHFEAAGAQTIAATGAIGADAFIKAIPQIAPASDFGAFITAGKTWALIDQDVTATPWPTAAATAALAVGTYVELQYALVDAQGTSVVGRVKGKNYIKEGALVKATEDQFLRVGYLVDIATEAKSLKQGYRYTYNIVLGSSTDATGGMVLDPDLIDQAGNPGDDSGKEPGDDVNEKAKDIGFDVSVIKWTEEAGSFEPIPNPLP